MCIGYFLTFSTYATHLHGDTRGSVDDEHSAYGTPFLARNEPWRRVEAGNAVDGPFVLNAAGRWAVDAAIRAVCGHRTWRLRALHVRTNHVHVVVSAECPPELVMNSFKAWSTRRMTECGLIERGRHVWARHGSTRHLFTDDQAESAIWYTLFEQGPLLRMERPERWRDDWGIAEVRVE